MAFQLSPGVLIKEVDLTSVVPAVGTSIGAFAGDFQWGPAEEVRTLQSENQLVEIFGKPNNTVADGWFTAASFLAYSSSLRVARAVGSAALNAGVAGGVLIKNDTDYENNHSAGSNGVGMWAAKWPGALGNSLKVDFCDHATFDAGSVLSIAISNSGSGYNDGDNTVTIAAPPAGGTQAEATPTIVAGAITGITVTNPGSGYATAPTITITDSNGTPGAGAAATATLSVAWQYANQFDGSPTTSTYASNVGASNDEMHVIVIDEDGLFTGTAGTVLEKFPFVSKAANAKDDVGASSYYKNVINTQSDYIWWTDHPSTDITFGDDAVNGLVYTSNFGATALSLSSGADAAPNDGEIQTAYDLFSNDYEIDVNLIITGAHTAAVQSYVQDNIALVRKDCVTFHSPLKASVVNNSGSEATDIKADRDNLTATSYSVMDTGWKYMYDRYNDVFRWVPCNGDTAGLCVNTDQVSDAWFSPAGYNRGLIKNAARLAYNPSKADRDDLYQYGVNPIVGFAGSGILLFGDKTLQSKPGAFDRINVRRLFIVLEKAIATAAKFQLFEINDEFTRAQFTSLVEPFLRDVQGRRGIFDFKVVCNESNNTEAVIDGNRFVADIFVKPYKSINFITLNFIATRTGVSFEEVGG
jgi:hypothetical protein